MARRGIPIPPAILAGFFREVEAADRGRMIFDRKLEALLDQALRPHWAAIARLLAPLGAPDGERVVLNVPCHVDYAQRFDLTVGEALTVSFDPKTGHWRSPTAAPFEPGLASFAAHVFHIQTGRADGQIAAFTFLLECFAVAQLRAYRDGVA